MTYITFEEEKIMEHFELMQFLWETKLLQDAFVFQMQSLTGCEGEYDA